MPVLLCYSVFYAYKHRKEIFEIFLDLIKMFFQGLLLLPYLIGVLCVCGLGLYFLANVVWIIIGAVYPPARDWSLPGE